MGIETRVADLSDPSVVADCLEGADFALNAVPGFMGFATLKGILESGTHVVDIAFFPEDCF